MTPFSTSPRDREGRDSALWPASGRRDAVLSDDAPEMVEVAARRAVGQPNVETAIFDQSAIRESDATFDAVINRHAASANPWRGLILDAVGEQFGVPFPPLHIPGPFSLDDRDHLRELLAAGGLEQVRVEAFATPMPARSLNAWWERVPQLAGPLAIALQGMEPDVREAIRRRALDADAAVAREQGDGIVLDGSVLIASGRRPD